MTQHESNSPEQNPSDFPQPPAPQEQLFAKRRLLPFLTVLGILIILSTSLFVWTILQPPVQATTVGVTGTASVPANGTQSSNKTPSPAVSPTLTPTPTVTSPLAPPNNPTVQPLQLPTNHIVLYEQQNGIYMVSSTAGSTSQSLTASGYVYNEAIRPILTPSGQLLYSGSLKNSPGIWLADIYNGTSTQIASFNSDQIITSMALSNDGATIAWSVGPLSGNGLVDLYAGPLNSPVKVFEQSATNCPCFHVFGFMNGTGKQGDSTLLLTDDLQSHEANQNGLWTFDLTNPSAIPQQLLTEDAQQGPLVLAPYSNVLLYSSNEGVAPVPTDGSVPDYVATLYFANSLDVTTLSGQPITLGPTQVILPEQHNLRNSADYHWVTTPVFTIDGHTIIYVEFNSDSQSPYDRTSAIFGAQINGSGKSLSVGSPHLLATSTAGLLELGPWFNNHILTFYADNSLYALDIQTGATSFIVHTGTYARIIAVTGLGTL
ncbi:MAG: TolB-like translocation protein [Ktedonobacteraceae bacterium]